MARITHEQAAEFNEVKHKDISVAVDTNAQLVNEVVAELIKNYTERLDGFIEKARDALYSNGSLTNEELDWYIMAIPIERYYTQRYQVDIEVKAEVAGMIKKRLYIEARENAEGTVEDKNNAAEKAVLQETLSKIAYDKAKALLKSKDTVADDILAAFKKVRSARIEEMGLLRYGGDDSGV